MYMAACQQMTGQGGWPLTIIMTPDRRPFYAATYIPKERRGPVPGLVELLPRIAEVWQKDHEHVLVTADKVLATITPEKSTDTLRDPDASLLDAGFDGLEPALIRITVVLGMHRNFLHPIRCYSSFATGTGRKETGPLNGGTDSGCDP